MSDEEWARAEVRRPVKKPVGLKLDDDILSWFKSQGRGYQTRINAVLRRYAEARRGRRLRRRPGSGQNAVQSSPQQRVSMGPLPQGKGGKSASG